MTDRVINESSKRITCGYNGYPGHKGVDLGWRSDETQNKVYANCKGTVVEIQDGLDRIPGSTGVKSWGNYVLIKHPNGMYSRYCHMKKGLLVKTGQEVDENVQLGVIGDSGNTTGRHHHFEVQTGYSSDTRINPELYLTKAIYEAPTQPSKPAQAFKYNVGDKVVFNGVLYVDAQGNGAGQSRANLVCTITKRAEGSKPYNIENGLCWVAEEDLQPYTASAPSFKQGDKVKIIGNGNSQASGKGKTAGGIGWIREIIKIQNGAKNPYCVGLNGVATGWYPASSLQKL